jgi:hypothetical protein
MLDIMVLPLPREVLTPAHHAAGGSAQPRQGLWRW